MNIQFKQITIENFRSIEKADVELSQQGIVIVKGVNDYEEKATSNGSGKSSIFEAIVFALFEETSNGEKDVANRIKNKGFNIQLSFSVDGIEYVIIRKNDGKKAEVRLLKNGEDISARNKTDTNKLIIQILGINKDLFLDSIFLSQESKTNLSSLQPTARKERLEILTNTDNVVNSFKEKLKELQIEYESKCVNWEKEKSKLEGNIQILTSQGDQYRNKIAEIEKQEAYRNSLGNIDEIEQKINTNIKVIDSIKADIIVTNQELNNQQQKIDTYKDKNKDLLEKQNNLLGALNTEKAKLTKIQNESDIKLKEIDFENKNIKNIDLEIEKILKSDTCPTCGRKYDDANEEHIKSTVNELKEKQQELENKVKELENLKDVIDKESIKQQEIISELLEQSLKLKTDIEEYNNNGNGLMLEKLNIQKELDIMNTTLNDIDKELKELQELKDIILKIQVGNKKEFQDLLDKCSIQLLELQGKQKEISEKWEVDNNYVGTLKHCQQLVTKDFRTYLLRNSVDYLNTILRQYSQELFSNESDIIQITNDDTKLDILLGNASYESLSGGEKTRVNIALLLAQKSLANSIGNISCNIIILDEILGYCDTEAEINIIDLIVKELSSLESIYMISHKEIQIGYDQVLIIQKDKSGLSHVLIR